MGLEAADIRILFPESIPHFQKHLRKVPYAFAFQPYPGILPVTETHLFVNIFIGQVDPSGKCGMPVNIKDFPVISVIHDQGKERNHRIEGHTFNPAFLQPFEIAARKQGHATHIIVYHPDIQAFIRLLLQNFQNLFPHFPFGNDKILHKDKMFGSP